MGNILSAHAHQHKTGSGQLARRLSITRAGVYYRLRSADMSIHTLWQMCRQLQHNFFADLSAQLPPFDDDRQSECEQRLQQQIDELQRTIDALNIELNIYKNIIKKPNT
jgi:hypothetical protein